MGSGSKSCDLCYVLLTAPAKLSLSAAFPQASDAATSVDLSESSISWTVVHEIDTAYSVRYKLGSKATSYISNYRIRKDFVSPIHKINYVIWFWGL
jgi:hypothetical protein